MKVVLLSLDGHETRAREVLLRTYSSASVESVRREDIESVGSLSALKLIRALRPEVFAFSMENLGSQRGQTLLSLFGAFSGASRVLALDAGGRIKSETRLAVLGRAPFRLLREIVSSGLAIMRTHKQLRRLERAVNDVSDKPQLVDNVKPIDNLKLTERDKVEFVFLRATPGPGTQAGGASSHINGFIEAAEKEGARIHVISNDRIAGFDEERLPFTIVPMEPLGVTRSAFDLRNNLVFTAGVLSAIRNGPFDFIYQRYSRFTWAGVAASLLSERPLFLEYNGSEVWVGKHWDDAGMFALLERFERLNLKAAKRVFVVSEVERSNLLRAGVPDQKIIVNPNGVDTEKFQPDIGGNAARVELGISTDQTVVGFVGSFGPWHGVLELAQAIVNVVRQSPLTFLLVGTGKLQKQAENIIKAGGAAERVIFTGAVDHRRVPLLLDACDILVAPHVPLADGSDFFGSPTKLFEYMAMGKGIVASRLGQIGDVLKHEETALLVEPGNVDELGAAIQRLAQLPELRRRLGENARRVAIENYTWRHNARRVLDAYVSWQKEIARN